MREIQTRLQEENPIFRKVWVQYSHNKTYRVVITIFPHDNSNYQMIFGTPTDLSYESINNILQNYLVV